MTFNASPHMKKRIMQNGEFFPYSWHHDDDQEEYTSIRIYGLDKDNKNVCVRVDDFTPYVYLELPTHIKWTVSKAQVLGDKIDTLMGRQKAVRKALVWKKKLYGAYINSDTGERRVFPYLFCSFSSIKDATLLGFRLKGPVHVIGIGSVKLKIHESDANPVLQLTCCKKLPTAGWVKFQGRALRSDDMDTLCDYEYEVKYKHLQPVLDRDSVPQPKIMGFDIEVNSSNPSAMPQAHIGPDKIFQISCVFAREGEGEETYKKYLLSLGDPDQKITGEEVIIYTYKTESALLIGFTDLIREENPNIITGYNILGFDIPYMIARSKSPASCLREFSKQGFHKYAQAKEKKIKWSSSAYKNQEFQFLDAEGRLYVDLLPLVRRDFKFNNYKLKTISTYFLGQTKDPLSVKGIFKCYRIGIKKNNQCEYGKQARKAMAIVGKYCVQDSALVVRLTSKLKTWVGLTEMAKTCNVPIFTLYTQGQQIKVYSQLYKYCMYQNIVVEKDVYEVKDNERYVGAKVFLPIPGKYKMVVPFDFASLYPTTIIAYNIDYHTWVPDGTKIPDSRCHVMEWEDHQNCEHDPKVQRKVVLTQYITKERDRIKGMRDRRNKCLDKLRKKEMMDEINKAVDDLKPYTTEKADLTKTIAKITMCEKRKYRFLKEPKGVLPTIIQNLLDARAHTRKVDMVKAKNEIKRLKAEGGDNDALIASQESLVDVLNKRQLAFKVSANSMYGAMGVRRGYLPFMPGAMCTTFMGRKNIECVADTITKKFDGELIYGDTDSNYIHFPHMENETSKALWDHSEYVANEVTKLFPPPIKLEFEEEIYSFFLILSKKRYMYRAITARDGDVGDNIGKKGVLLARRDNSKFVRDVYEGVVKSISNHESTDKILYFVLEQINQMCSGCKPYTDFVITKAVGAHGDLIAQETTNEKGEKKAIVGDYTVPILSRNNEEREEQMKKKGANTPQEFYLLCLPAQVQLAERMRKRGKRVDTGTRLEYVVTDPENHTDKQYNKVESAEYLARHSDIIKIDYMYYLKALVNPLDQILDVTFKNESKFTMGFTMDQYKYRWKIRSKLLAEIQKLSTPRLKFN